MTNSIIRSPNSAGHPKTSERAKALGRKVRYHRKAQRLSQEKLAEKAGCDRQSINRVENAAYSPSFHRLCLIADALDVPISVLVDEDAQPDQIRMYGYTATYNRVQRP